MNRVVFSFLKEYMHYNLNNKFKEKLYNVVVTLEDGTNVRITAELVT